MKIYILNAETRICLDDVEKTIVSITSSSFIENIAVAYTKDVMAYNGLAHKLIESVSGSFNFGPGAYPFTTDTEENFNRVKEEVINKLNSF